MSAPNPDIEDLLTPKKRPEPPADLLRKLEAQIPERFTHQENPRPRPVEAPPRRRSPAWTALAAAAAVAAVLLAFLLLRQTEPPQSRPTSVAVVAEARPTVPALTPSEPVAVAVVPTVLPTVGPKTRTLTPGRSLSKVVGGEKPGVSIDGIDTIPDQKGALLVQVKDASGAPLPGVSVRIEGLSAGSKSLVSNVEGVAVARDLQAGGYSVTAELSGFQPVLSSVEVPAGDTARAQLQMSLDSVVSSVVVSGEAPVVDTTSKHSYTFDDALPRKALLSERVYTAPGVLAPAPSAGGTAKRDAAPVDEPKGALFFKLYGVNGFHDTRDEILSSFDLAAPGDSYALTRSFLRAGTRPPAGSVRTEDFVHAFARAKPAVKGDVELSIEGGPVPSPRGPSYRYVRLQLSTSSLDTEPLEASVRVEFDPRSVARFRLVGHDRLEAGEGDAVRGIRLPPGSVRSALYEIQLEPTPAGGPLVTLRVRVKSKESSKLDEKKRTFMTWQLSSRWEKTSAPFRAAVLASRFA
ncbi:MAG: von Willebrand factor type A domain-containing protein, partial [Acidobacteria bacterium]|nr:von Willebrand factor type A domain-containing protein [Acidobacteriota bacterium]